MLSTCGFNHADIVFDIGFTGTATCVTRERSRRLYLRDRNG
jgi:hypothetical protein